VNPRAVTTLAGLLVAPAALAAVSSWRAAPSLPSARENHATIVAGAQFYFVIGGYDGTNYLQGVSRTEFEGSPGGLPLSFTPETALPFGMGGHQAVYANSTVYVMGSGQTGVYMSSVTPNVLSWTATTGLPAARSQGGALAAAGRLYALGGTSGGASPTPLNDVISAPINTDGTLGSWRTESQAFMPTGRSLFGLAQWGNRFYVLGGLAAAATSYPLGQVLVYSVNPSTGEVSAPQATTALPSARYALSAVADAGFVYAFGGIDTTGYLDEVWAARVLSDGTLGPWVKTQSLPAPRAFFAASVTTDHGVLVSGGYNGQMLGDVQRGDLTAPGPAAQMAFKTNPQTVAKGSCSQAVTIELRDQDATPVATDQFLTATVSGTPAIFYADATCSTGLGSLGFEAGRSTSSFYFRSTTEGQLGIDVTATGLASTAQTESITGPVNTPDAGTPDAGTSDATNDPHSVNGFGCSSVPAWPWAAPALLWALWWSRQRRKESQP
jgi:hypothetical protein